MVLMSIMRHESLLFSCHHEFTVQQHQINSIGLAREVQIISAVVEDRFLCRHVGSNSIPTATIVDKTNAELF